MRLVVVVSVALAALLLWTPSVTVAADPEPLCSLNAATETSTARPDDATKTSEPEPKDALSGRLGGSRDSFEERFGKPADDAQFTTSDSAMFVTYTVEGCGDVVADFHEGLVTDMMIFSPGFEQHKAEWTIAEARKIAERLLPSDVKLDKPYRITSAVEHQECSSAALADGVPEDVYAYVDNNPTPGQCSVVYQLDDNDKVPSFTVQLKVEDPN